VFGKLLFSENKKRKADCAGTKERQQKQNWRLGFQAASLDQSAPHFEILNLIPEGIYVIYTKDYNNFRVWSRG